LKKQGYNQTFITNSMGRSNSTISRELSRNTGNRGYRHKQANNLACEQYRQKNKHNELTAEIKHYISKKLKEYGSPEQIVECLERIFFPISLLFLVRLKSG
jgi:IS30 family transposase